jgi:hypothetical protein
MTNEPRDKLTPLLRQWAERQSLDEKAMETLRAQVVQQLQDSPGADLRLLPPAGRRSPLVGRVAWFSLGAAATLLIAAFLWPCRPVDQPAVETATSEDSSALALFSKPQLEEKATLLSEMERLFANRLAWVAEDSGEVRIGVAGDGEKPSQGVPIAVRVVVVARKIGSLHWKPVWNVDVVTRGEQTVDITPPGHPGESFQIWALPLPDGMVAVDTNVALNGDGSAATQSSSSGIQKADTPNRTFRLKKGDVEYEVYQTVSLLKDRVG